MPFNGRGLRTKQAEVRINFRIREFRVEKKLVQNQTSNCMHKIQTSRRSQILLPLTALAFFAAGCATNNADLFGSSDGKNSKTQEYALKQGSPNDPANKDAGDTQIKTTSEDGTIGSTEIYYRDKKILNTTFDLPVEMNRPVEKWIDYFTGKGRDRFEHYLERSEYFIPYLKPILKNAKAPEDLVYLALIESGFNNNARSGARAVGAWQFMSATGRRYGLEVNWWIDERRDVEKSTIAAVQYLKELNAMFGSWHLATAAYNAGEAKIQRAIKKYHTNDFWELTTRGKYLRPETKNYVPKLFAAAIICKNRKLFGFEESYTKITQPSAELVSQKAEESDDLERLPDELDADKAKDEKDAAKEDKIAKAEGKEVNPAESTVELTKDSPADPEEEAILQRDSVESMLRTMSNGVRTPHVNKKGEVNGSILAEVEIPSPADLFKVSSAAGLSYMEFKSMNPELLRWVTPPNQKSYKVRIPLNRKEAFVKKYFDASFKKDVTFLTYKTRKGESASKIAKRFGISADPVAEMNGTSSVNAAFAPGKMVQLPIPSDFVRSLASLKTLDLIDPAEKSHRRRHGRHSRQARSISTQKKASNL
jgi:LysM repeat protein